ncbi:hypothetical protein IGB42_04259 [Andreprevotia sp. IGB-42]|uniref:DUF475 domain-containing protein n=1 Tax=Andreprevotia sp. IGB-42 TaxID=2497473 RepID=UPI0013580922|nr:DUF475 domain-containing protein [Andreprevotia sp. IGB-42]KAF0811270.1 hypothetical protein IGB42_04259 [Andreprevotia sp. IGB-42]
MLHYFRSSLIVTVIGLVLAGVLAGGTGVWIAFNLALLETSLSFDNAVVNASVLKHWDEKWRKRFLLWGMLVAVFGMRIVFPLVIVAVLAGIAPLPGPVSLWDWLSSGAWPGTDVLSMAVARPHEYASTLQSAHIQVTAFGGAFLMLVFLNFFLDRNKDEHWFVPVEKILVRIGRLQMAALLLSLLVLLLVTGLLPQHDAYAFLVAGLWGVVAYSLVDGLGDLIGDEGAAAKTGWSGFIYLELLDASFSFDGVLGAFALTKNIFLIAIGLGIGAMFVRSFTLLLVEKGTLSTLRYLEHGAFWAIGALAAVMLLAARWHIPEAVTGGVAALLILLAGLHSWWDLRRTKASATRV